MTWTPGNANMFWNDSTDFEQLLNATDKANRAHYFLATRERVNYNHNLYKISSDFLFAMYLEITGGDEEIARHLADLMVDNGEDVRYNLIYLFKDAKWAAQNLAWLDKEESNYGVGAMVDHLDDWYIDNYEEND